MSNVSTVDDFPNITRDFNEPFERLFLGLFTVVSLMSFFANSVLVFVIIKYKNLRKDATNVIFLHLNIWEAILLLVAPLTLAASLNFYGGGVPDTVLSAIYYLENNAFIVICFFLLIMICDGYVKIYNKNAYRKFIRLYKYFIVGVYVLFVCSSLFTTYLCFNSFIASVPYVVMLIVIPVMVLFLIVMNVTHAIKKRKLRNCNSSNIGLAVANILLLVWIPCLAFLPFLIIYRLNTPVAFIILFSLGFSSPIFNLVYLYFCAKSYKVCLRQVFTCRCGEYENEKLEGESVIYNGEHCVEIPNN